MKTLHKHILDQIRPIPFSVFFMVLIFMGSISCSLYKPYTYELKQELELSEEQLHKIPFYLSRVLILEKGQRQYEYQYQKQNTKVIERRNIDELIFKPTTTGLLANNIGDTLLTIRFEPDSLATLRFKRSAKDGRYYLYPDTVINSYPIFRYKAQEYIYPREKLDVYIILGVEQKQVIKRKPHIVKGIHPEN